MLVKSCTPVCPDLPVCYMIALFAGTDVDCGGYYPAHAKEAVESGKLDVRYINRGIQYIVNHNTIALVNLFKVQMRLGLFDPLSEQPYFFITYIMILVIPSMILISWRARNTFNSLKKLLNRVLSY